MYSHLFLRGLGVLVLTCSLVQPALAGLMVTNSGYNGSTTVFNQNGVGKVDQVVGWTFTVGSNDLQVTALGEWDYSAARGLGGGLPSSILVGLWDNSDGRLLASVFVPVGTSGTTLINDFRFVTLATPVILESGQTYTVGDRRYPFNGTQSQFDLQGVGNTPTGGLDVAFGTNVNTSLSYDITVTPLKDQRPTQNIGGSAYRWLGPNVEYTVIPTSAVPEPASLILVAVSLAMLGYTRNARRSTAGGGHAGPPTVG